MKASTIQLFVNPRAGSRSARRTAALIAALEARGAQLIITESTTNRLVVDDRADHVCAVGGDGTVRHVVEAVSRTGRVIPISVYPTGTVNLLAKEHGYPRDPVAFAERVLNPGVQRHHHPARVGGLPLLTCASVGPDSHAVARLSNRLKSLIGRAAYLIAFVGVLIRWPRPKITLFSDDRRTDCEAVYIAKGRFFAGRWSFAPEAEASDPRLHVVALESVSRMRFLRFVCALLRHQPVHRLPGVRCFVCTELTLQSACPAPLQADGDIVGYLPQTISMGARALQFG